MTLFNSFLSQYRSSLYETARTLLKSRNSQAARAERLELENRRLRKEIERITAARLVTEQQHDQAKQLLHQERIENQRLREQPIRLANDLPLPGHRYGAKMICLSLKLVQRLGFRPSEAALKIVFEFLGIDANIPSHDSMRSWSLRLGIALLG